MKKANEVWTTVLHRQAQQGETVRDAAIAKRALNVAVSPLNSCDDQHSLQCCVSLPPPLPTSISHIMSSKTPYLAMCLQRSRGIASGLKGGGAEQEKKEKDGLLSFLSTSNFASRIKL